MSQYIIKPPLGTPLNKHHPLSKGLVGAWLMNEGRGNYFYGPQSIGSFVGSPYGWVPKGFYLDQGDDEYIDFGGSVLYNLSTFTFLTKFIPVGWGEGGFGRLLNKRLGGQGWEAYLNSSGYVRYAYYGSITSRTNIDTSAGSITLGKQYDYIVTNTPDTTEIYLDGTLHKTTISSCGTADTSAFPLVFGVARSAGLVREANAILIHQLLWN